MKKIALAAALSVAATSAFAGGMVEPMAAPAEVAKASSSSAGGYLVPLLVLVALAVAASRR